MMDATQIMIRQASFVQGLFVGSARMAEWQMRFSQAMLRAMLDDPLPDVSPHPAPEGAEAIPALTPKPAPRRKPAARKAPAKRASTREDGHTRSRGHPRAQASRPDVCR